MKWHSTRNRWEGGIAWGVSQTQLRTQGPLDTPFAIWANPVGSEIIVDITGTLGMWRRNNIAPGTGQDFAIVLRDPVTGTTTLLDSVNWEPGGFGNETPSWSISVLDVNVPEGHEILFTARNESNDANHTYSATDDLIITLDTVVPEPASLGLLALGAVAMLRRRA